MENPQVPEPEQHILHRERKNRLRTRNRRRNKRIRNEDRTEQNVREFEPTVDD